MAISKAFRNLERAGELGEKKKKWHRGQQTRKRLIQLSDFLSIEEHAGNLIARL